MLIINKELNNMEQEITKYKKWLAVAETFKSQGVESKDRNIDEDIKNYKAIIKMYQNPKIVAELNAIWNK